ncbi:MAG TPA: metallophosphoesterase [Candidatus Tectomicrobia bacterium]|nr:metallophosphoesterase [Candidatus Tectomicrobia bacterium]
MRVGIFGDIHGWFEPTRQPTIEYFRDIVAALDCDLMLQVGDMCHYRSFARPVYWIYGNNDWPPAIADIEAGRREARNLRHLKTGEAVPISVGQETLWVAGLNGAYDPLYSEACAADGGDPEAASFFTSADVDAMLAMRGQRIDVLLTHGCPAGLGFGREPDHAVPALRQVLDALQPAYMFCGHAHLYRYVRHGPTHVYALAQLLDEYYVLDTGTQQLERIPSRPLTGIHGRS